MWNARTKVGHNTLLYAQASDTTPSRPPQNKRNGHETRQTAGTDALTSPRTNRTRADGSGRTC